MRAALSWGVVSAFLALGAFACAVNDGPEESESRRGAIGKADLYGMCMPEDCGGKSSGSCWCDDLCDVYGDCCANEVSVCDLGCGPVLCELYCEDGFATGDDGCEICACNDPEPVCPPADEYCDAVCAGEPLPEVPAGCPLPGCACEPSCPPADAYCDAVCGAQPLPEVPAGCPLPGCACEQCGGFAGWPCSPGKICVDDPNDDCDPAAGGADCGGLCVDPPGDSCAEHCDGQSSDGSCWCDDLCTGYGDCCADYAVMCL